MWDDVGAQVRQDMRGDLGRGAIRDCRSRLGISIPVTNGKEVARAFGAEKGMAFTKCVVDAMYPE